MDRINKLQNSYKLIAEMIIAKATDKEMERAIEYTRGLFKDNPALDKEAIEALYKKYNIEELINKFQKYDPICEPGGTENQYSNATHDVALNDTYKSAHVGIDLSIDANAAFDNNTTIHSAIAKSISNSFLNGSFGGNRRMF